MSHHVQRWEYQGSGQWSGWVTVANLQGNDLDYKESFTGTKTYQFGVRAQNANGRSWYSGPLPFMTNHRSSSTGEFVWPR